MRYTKGIFSIMTVVLLTTVPMTYAFSYNPSYIPYNGTQPVVSFKIILTEDQQAVIDEFIDAIPSNDDRSKAKEITGRLFEHSSEIDINIFGDLLKEFCLEDVMDHRETTEIIDDLLYLVLDLILERLGWVNDLFEKTSDVLYSAQMLWNDRSLPGEILSEISNVIEKFKELRNFSLLLIQGKYLQFLKTWSVGVIINDILQIIESIEMIADDIGRLTGDISLFVSDTIDLIEWLNSKPWEYQIKIYGKVMESSKGAPNVTVHCRGVISTTDEEGNFSFFVNSTPDNQSIPPDVYYGIHQCVITVEGESLEKETPEEFSYVFSNGSIYWLFLIDEDEPAHNMNQKNNCLQCKRLLNHISSMHHNTVSFWSVIKSCGVWSHI